jgi:protein gp37
LKSLDVWPLPNLWIGCSIEDQETANKRLPLLQLIPAHRRFVSIEPLIDSIDLGFAYPCGYYCDSSIGHVDHPFWSWGTDTQLNWLIMGAESGSQSRPFEPAWLETIIQQADLAGVPLFIKQLGSHWASRSGNSRVDPRGEDASLWPFIWRIQQIPPDLAHFFDPFVVTHDQCIPPAQMQFEIKGE